MRKVTVAVWLGAFLLGLVILQGLASAQEKAFPTRQLTYMATRRVPGRAFVPKPEGLLKPGIFLTVRLSRGAVDALLVPEHTLVPEQGDLYVFVVTDGSAEKRKIRIGQRRVGDVQVVEGLAAGGLVVTEGTQKLRDGANVTLQETAVAAGKAGTGES